MVSGNDRHDNDNVHQTHSDERRRITDVVDNNGHYDYINYGPQNDHNNCPHTYDSQNRTCTIDTAPFDVTAFLNYLDQRDRDFDNCHSIVDNIVIRSYGCKHHF